MATRTLYLILVARVGFEKAVNESTGTVAICAVLCTQLSCSLTLNICL